MKIVNYICNFWASMNNFWHFTIRTLCWRVNGIYDKWNLISPWVFTERQPQLQFLIEIVRENCNFIIVFGENFMFVQCICLQMGEDSFCNDSECV